MPVAALEPLAAEEAAVEEAAVEEAAVEDAAAELLEEVAALVQLVEAKAATPSANADSNGAANEAARD